MDPDVCPSCGAEWAAGAAWCNLCFTPAPTSAAPESRATPSAASALTISAGVQGAKERAPEVTGEPDAAAETTSILEWACPTCGEENPLDNPLCSICGTPFGRLFEEKPGELLEPSRAALLGYVPGLAMIKLGRGGEGVLRMFVALASVVWVALFGFSCGGAAKVGLVATWGVFVVFLIAESSIDSRRLAEGKPFLLKGKVLMYGFAGLLLITVLLVIAVSIGVDTTALNQAASNRCG